MRGARAKAYREVQGRSAVPWRAGRWCLRLRGRGNDPGFACFLRFVFLKSNAAQVDDRLADLGHSPRRQPVKVMPVTKCGKPALMDEISECRGGRCPAETARTGAMGFSAMCLF